MTPSSPESRSHPNLTVPLAQAEAEIVDQIVAGEEIGQKLDDPEYSLEDVRTEHVLWHNRNQAMLSWMFEPPDAMLERYERAGPPTIGLQPPPRSRIPPAPGTEERKEAETIKKRIIALASIKETLRYCEEPNATPSVEPAETEAPARRDVFVVHGHDEAAREAVARFIEKLGLRAVLLREQADGGRTIIEKLEEESSDVGLAVVLLTPDDVGAPGDQQDDIRGRARQNVIFELGFFVGKLGRAKVCILHKGDVDIPSDYHGVIYVPMGDGDAWRLRLAKEIRQAAIDFDPSKVLES